MPSNSRAPWSAHSWTSLRAVSTTSGDGDPAARTRRATRAVPDGRDEDEPELEDVREDQEQRSLAGQLEERRSRPAETGTGRSRSTWRGRPVQRSATTRKSREIDLVEPLVEAPGNRRRRRGRGRPEQQVADRSTRMARRPPSERPAEDRQRPGDPDRRDDEDLEGHRRARSELELGEVRSGTRGPGRVAASASSTDAWSQPIVVPAS